MTLPTLLLFLFPGPAAPLPPASDTFGDADVQALVEAARAARGVAEDGLLSFDGRMWERIYVGLDGVGFRRERGLFRQERTARIRWVRDGERIVRWEAARMDVPIAGMSSQESESMARGLARSLARGMPPPPLAFEPGSDRILFGSGEWALHPLADTAGLHYRYASGDTLRITLPEDGRRLVLAEVRVRPRRPEFRLLAASLWFDVATGFMVRAVYRPSRPFELSVDGGEDDVPRIFRPVRAEIRIVSVEHSLHDFRWWIPRRFTFEGEGQVGRLARFPVSVEWTVSDILVNQEIPGDLVPDPLPEGWTLRRPGDDQEDADAAEDREQDQQATAARREDQEAPGDEEPPASPADEEEDEEEEGPPLPRVLVVVPPAPELAGGPGLSPPDDVSATAFRPEELRELEGRVRQLYPSVAGFRPTFGWGLEGGLTRYNRVEGLASGVGARMDLPGGRTLQAEVRSGLAAPLPTGEVSVSSGARGDRVGLSAYRRLVGSSDWADPHSLSASVASLVLGDGPDPFHRAWGGEVVLDRTGALGDRRLRLFAERHGSAETGTDFHLRGIFSHRPLAPVPPSDEGGYLGAMVDQRWQTGLDPQRARLFGRWHLEAATGARDYFRVRGATALTVPLAPGWAGGLEAGAGWGSTRLPLQRRFFPGGAEGFRGGRVGEEAGRSFWLLRSELGRGPPAFHLVGFTDILRVDPFGTGEASPVRVAAGLGVSVLDGLGRVELARQVNASAPWRLFIYLDGLF
jgi:hypothetical protein